MEISDENKYTDRQDPWWKDQGHPQGIADALAVISGLTLMSGFPIERLILITELGHFSQGKPVLLYSGDDTPPWRRIRLRCFRARTCLLETGSASGFTVS